MAGKILWAGVVTVLAGLMASAGTEAPSVVRLSVSPVQALRVTGGSAGTVQQLSVHQLRLVAPFPGSSLVDQPLLEVRELLTCEVLSNVPWVLRVWAVGEGAAPEKAVAVRVGERAYAGVGRKGVVVAQGEPGRHRLAVEVQFLGEQLRGWEGEVAFVFAVEEAAHR